VKVRIRRAARRLVRRKRRVRVRAIARAKRTLGIATSNTARKTITVRAPKRRRG